MFLLTLFYFLGQICSNNDIAKSQSTWQAFYENYHYVIDQVQSTLIQANSTYNYTESFYSAEMAADIKSLFYMLRPTLFGVKLHLLNEEDKPSISKFLQTPELLLGAMQKHPYMTKLDGFLVEFCPMFLGSMEQLWNNTNWKAASDPQDEYLNACLSVDALCSFMVPSEEKPVANNTKNETISVEINLGSIAETITVLSKIHKHIYDNNDTNDVLMFDDYLASTLGNIVHDLKTLNNSAVYPSWMYELAKTIPAHLVDIWSNMNHHKAKVLAPKTAAAWASVQEQCLLNNYYEYDSEFASVVSGICKSFDFAHQVHHEEAPLFDLSNEYELLNDGYNKVYDILEEVKKNFTNTGSHVLDEFADYIMSNIVEGTLMTIKESNNIKLHLAQTKPAAPDIHEGVGVYAKYVKYMHEIMTSSETVQNGILKQAKQTVHAFLQFAKFYKAAKNDITIHFWADNDPDSLFLKEISAFDLLAQTVANMVNFD